MTNEERIAAIAKHQAEIMKLLNLDLKDPSLKDTPKRVGKMYVEEIFKGLFCDAPNISVFPNVDNYDQMVVSREVTVNSICEHHFIPFVGFAYIAYIPEKYFIGLSKINRIVDYFARRPQLQERLTSQIAYYIMDKLQTNNVAVKLDCKHLCVNVRGVRDNQTLNTTCYLGGIFRDTDVKQEFYNLIQNGRTH